MLYVRRPKWEPSFFLSATSRREQGEKTLWTALYMLVHLHILESAQMVGDTTTQTGCLSPTLQLLKHPVCAKVEKCRAKLIEETVYHTLWYRVARLTGALYEETLYHTLRYKASTYKAPVASGDTLDVKLVCCHGFSAFQAEFCMI